MKTAKIFETSEMTHAMFKWLLECGWVIADGTNDYSVGYLSQEAEDPGFCPQDAEMGRAFDAWLMNQGASHKEHVLIHHGEWRETQDFLFRS